jgi:2-dehydro-3-deoxygalactonokinase
LAAACDGSALAARLFTARARVVGGAADPQSTPSYLSGLLIGSEVASVPPLIGAADATIVLLGDPVLCGRYRRALAHRDVASETFDGEQAAIAGLFALHQLGAPA